jgi:hypothetical protein
MPFVHHYHDHLDSEEQIEMRYILLENNSRLLIGVYLNKLFDLQVLRVLSGLLCRILVS